MKSELTAWFRMEDRAPPELERAVEREGRKARRIAKLFTVNGYLCASERTAVVLGQHDLGSGGMTPVEGQFWALNFGAKKTTLAMEECRSRDGPYGNGMCRPELGGKDDDFAVTHAALDGPDLWGDERVETGFFVSPCLGAALHKAGLAKVFHLMRCRIV